MPPVPPASARPVAAPVAPAAAAPDAGPPGAVAPGAVAPGAARQAPPAAAARDVDQHERVMGHVAGSMLTGALFFGAGVAIALCPVLAPFFAIAGCIAGVDFLADLAGFSPVKMATGKSLGGWTANLFGARPSEPEGAPGVSVRRGQQPRRRAPIEAEPLAPPQRRDDAAPVPDPVPVPVS